MAVTAPENVADLLAPLLGSRLSFFVKQDHSWGVAFECGFGMTVSCPWRVVANGGIAVSDEDHGQRFGLPAPVDAAAMAVTEIGAAPVSAARLDQETADLRIEFLSGARLEVWNNSCGYEGWTADLPWAQGKATLVAMGGGQIAVWRP